MEHCEIEKLPKHEALAVYVTFPDEPGKVYSVLLFRGEIEGYVNLHGVEIVRIRSWKTGKELWHAKRIEKISSEGIEIPTEDE